MFVFCFKSPITCPKDGSNTGCTPVRVTQSLSLCRLKVTWSLSRCRLKITHCLSRCQLKMTHCLSRCQLKITHCLSRCQMKMTHCLSRCQLKVTHHLSLCQLTPQILHRFQTAAHQSWFEEIPGLSRVWKSSICNDFKRAIFTVPRLGLKQTSVRLSVNPVFVAIFSFHFKQTVSVLFICLGFKFLS